MKRLITGELEAWKHQSQRRPLLLQGARQVGKTYTLERFGQTDFERFHRFDFGEEPGLKSVFAQDLNPSRIIRDLGLHRNVDITVNRDLLIFDEIQHCPKALASLKYFAEQMPSAFVCGSGSLLGIGLSEDLFPVGKVAHLRLYPMTFREFLGGMEQTGLEEAWLTMSPRNPGPDVIRAKLWEYFKYYLVVGGLPEIVGVFRTRFDRLNEAFEHVRIRQKELTTDYLNDIAKHSGKLKAIRVESVFRNVPIQLARETAGTGKFVFRGVLETGSRYTSLEGPIAWLARAGLIHKVMICTQAAPPLVAYANEKRFKLYLFDVGILGAMLDLSPRVVLAHDYGYYKGYFMENAVLMELVARWNRSFYSWHSNTAEIEFLLENEGVVVPVEVKSGINRKAKSLQVFRERFKPRQSLLLSTSGLKDLGDGRIHMPLYLAARFPLDR